MVADSSCLMWQILDPCRLESMPRGPVHAVLLYATAQFKPSLCRYLDNMTSERVDAEGVKNVAVAAKENLKAKVCCQAPSASQFYAS